MSLDADDMKEHREEQQKRRAKRLPIRKEEIFNLGKEGYDVSQLSQYQYRVNGLIDIYPTHRRYHILKTGVRGTYPANGLSAKIKSLL